MKSYKGKQDRARDKAVNSLLNKAQGINNKKYKFENVEQELKQKLVEALEILTEKERRVVELYYYEDLTLKEISLVLEVSESRVSQLHTKALLKMRKKMGAYMEILL